MQKSKPNKIGRFLRRAAALFFATLAAWLAASVANPALAVRQLGARPELVYRALRAELGRMPAQEETELAGWPQLVLGESLLLRAGGQADAAGQTAA